MLNVVMLTVLAQLGHPQPTNDLKKLLRIFSNIILDVYLDKIILHLRIGK